MCKNNETNDRLKSSCKGGRIIIIMHLKASTTYPYTLSARAILIMLAAVAFRKPLQYNESYSSF